jgi:predicted Ser/Thr protein kinase
MDGDLSIHSQKNGVDVRGDAVVKQYFHVRKGGRRFELEVEALRRMAGVAGIPRLVEESRAEQRIVMSRLPGTDLKKLTEPPPDSCFLSLRRLVEEMLECGVARHAIPARDVIALPDGTAGMVDFERITLRRGRGGLVWRLACRITRFHLLRLIDRFAPHLLTAEERRRFEREWRVRMAFRKFIRVKDWLRRKKSVPRAPGTGG